MFFFAVSSCLAAVAVAGKDEKKKGHVSLQNILPAQKKEEMWLRERERVSKTMRSSVDAANRSGTVRCAPRMTQRPHMDPLSSAPDLNASTVSAYKRPRLRMCIDNIERQERKRETEKREGGPSCPKLAPPRKLSKRKGCVSV